MRSTLSIMLSFVFLFSSSVFAANETICKNGQLERKVEVAATESGKTVPCEVRYTKEGSDAGKVLWSAQNEEAYCLSKAKEFVEKLISMGWQCTAASESPAPQQ